MNERNKKVIDLAQKILDESDLPSTTIYLLDVKKAPPSSESINRVFGPPIGIEDSSWPVYKEMKKLVKGMGIEFDDDTRMDHVFTLAVHGLHLEVPKNTRAMALFLSYCHNNEAWEPRNKHTKVIFLSTDDLSKGEYKGKLPKKMPKKAMTFQLIPVKVPKTIFFPPFGEESEDPMVQLNDALLCAGYVGGEPIWIQNDESPGDPFIMQFDESFADINLGDAGVMYVFLSTAFWQCV